MIVEYIRGDTSDVMIQVSMPNAPAAGTLIRCRNIDWVVYQVNYVYCSRGGIGGEHIGATANCAAIPTNANKIGEEVK